MANIIGDIAGQYDTLMALIKKMPEDEIISVGDMVDRGPKSKEVIEWFMKNGKAHMGNHEHFMLHECRNPSGIYVLGDWARNGGPMTLKSYDPQVDADRIRTWALLKFKDLKEGKFDKNAPPTADELYYRECLKVVPEDVLEWLSKLPLYTKESDLFISHAPKYPYWPLEKCTDNLTSPKSLIWSRDEPRRFQNTIQIFGHNASEEVAVYRDDEGVYAYCIDTSWNKTLTGIHWPTQEIYQQEYIE